MNLLAPVSCAKTEFDRVYPLAPSELHNPMLFPKRMAHDMSHFTRDCQNLQNGMAAAFPSTQTQGYSNSAFTIEHRRTPNKHKEGTY
jgi:hypothetical protein